jgi:hypothetical protein
MALLLSVKNSNISLKEQTVLAIAEPSLSYNTVLTAIKAKGRTCGVVNPMKFLNPSECHGEIRLWDRR